MKDVKYQGKVYRLVAVDLNEAFSCQQCAFKDVDCDSGELEGNMDCFTPTGIPGHTFAYKEGME